MLEFCFYFLVKSTFSSVLTVSLLFAFVAFWATAASSFTFLFPLQTMKQMMAAPKKRVSQKTDFVWFGLNISLYFVCFVSFVAPSAGGEFPLPWALPLVLILSTTRSLQDTYNSIIFPYNDVFSCYLSLLKIGEESVFYEKL